MQLTASLITSRPDLNQLSSEWNELLRQSEAESLFLTWEWISAWLDSVHPEASLFVVAVRDDSRTLVAVAPFYLARFVFCRIMPYRYLRILGDCNSGAEYQDIIVKRGFENQALAVICQCLSDNNSRWECAWFPHIAGWTGARERFERIFGNILLFRRSRQKSFSNTELPASYEKFIAMLTRDSRRILRRNENRLRQGHDIRLIWCERAADVAGFLEHLMRIHGLRWQKAGQAGSFGRRPLMKGFYHKFAPVAFAKGWLRIALLEVDGIAVAAQIGYVYNSIFYSLVEGYDPDGPTGSGIVLRNRVIMQCIEQGLRAYDHLGEHTLHKQHWGARERAGCSLFLGRKTLKNRLLALREIWPSGRLIDQGYPANSGRSAC